MRLKVLAVVVLIALTGALGMAQSTPNNPFPTGNTPVPGVFNTNFDPPMFQCYSAAVGCQAVLSATGAQTGIDLRGTPIDTHSIKWSPVGTVSTCQIQVESSADGSTWNTADIIPSTLCTSKGETSVMVPGVAFVRVNLTVLTGGGSLNVVYGGRFASVTNQLNFPAQQILPTDYFYVTYTDLQSTYTTATMYVSWQLQNTSGSRVLNTQTLTITPSTSNQYIGPLTAGTLANVTANLQSGTSPFQFTGGLYVQIFLCPNNNGGVAPNANLNQCIELIGSNLNTAYAVTWPGTPITAPTVGPGHAHSLHPSNPSAGATLSYTIPNTTSGGSDLRQEVKSLQFVFIASATAATRQIQVLFQNSGANAIVQEAIPCVVTAGQAAVITLAPGMTPTVTVAGSNIFCTQAIPDLYMSGFDGSWTMVIENAGSSWQSGDQLSGIFLNVQGWNDVD